MKRLIFVGLFFLVGISACSEVENDYMSNGTITGVDIRECICCGGYFIDIDNITYRFDVLPGGSNLNLDNPTFPIYVKLDWDKVENGCLGDEIKVLRIEKR